MSSSRGRHVVERRPRSRCRSCPTSVRPSHGSAKIVRPPPAGTIAPPPVGRRSRDSVTCVPRLGRMRGTSSSSVQLLGADAVRPDAGRVDDVACRAPRTRRRVSVSRTSTPAARPSRSTSSSTSQRLAHTAPKRSASPSTVSTRRDVVGLAVVEEVGRGRLARRRAPGPARPPRRRRSCGGGRGSSPRRASRRAPARAQRHHVVHVQPDSRCRRSGRLPSKAGTRSGSGLTRCGASFTISWRSSSASRTSPRSKFCR